MQTSERTIEQGNNGNDNRHLIIVGGGSAAFAAAFHAKGLGVRVTMINDRLPIGGTCVNVGCIPSKNLIRAAETLHKANHNAFDGIRTSGKVDDFHAIIEAKRRLIQGLREQKYSNHIQDLDGFEYIEGRATMESPTSVKVGDRTIEGSHILLCTGAHPFIPDIEGLSDVNYLTNEEAFELDALPESLIVVGGSYIAVEVAQMFSRLGTKVTILQRSERILSTEQADLTDELAEHFALEGITIVTGNAIQKVSEVDDVVTVHTKVNGKEETFSAQKLIMATGRKANTADMNLEAVGVALERNGAVKVDAYLQTSVPTIYAAGDVLGSNMFVYAATYEGKLAVDNAFTAARKEADFKVLPWVIFTDPQVAGVGLDEAQARAEGLHVDTAFLPMSHVPRAVVANDPRGFIKLIRNRDTDTLVGARILAPEGSELLMEIALAIKFGIKVSELSEMLHPYFTLAEGIKLAASTFSQQVEEFDCSAP